MLWLPNRAYGDYSLKLQWRDDAPGSGNANGGVFVRFPKVHDHPEESRPEWVAIKYGHEIQINDRPDGDMYKTGSVYGFDRVGLGGAGVTPKGTWNDYEIKVVDQTYEIYRNGVLINRFDNTRGQLFEPPRATTRAPTAGGSPPGTSGSRSTASPTSSRTATSASRSCNPRGEGLRWPRPHAPACGRGLPGAGAATPRTPCRRPAPTRRGPGTGRRTGGPGSRRRCAGR